MSHSAGFQHQRQAIQAKLSIVGVGGRMFLSLLQRLLGVQAVCWRDGVHLLSFEVTRKLCTVSAHCLSADFLLAIVCVVYIIFVPAFAAIGIDGLQCLLKQTPYIAHY